MIYKLDNANEVILSGILYEWKFESINIDSSAFIAYTPGNLTVLCSN